jgi:hypothetical protein
MVPSCRAERLKLEKDYLELQAKAFAAPGSALVEVRGRKSKPLQQTQLSEAQPARALLPPVAADAPILVVGCK